jgi:hypothetical protein
MKRTAVFFVGCVGFAALSVAGCSAPASAPGYTQSRAIDQDIDTTHANMPSLSSPNLATEDRDPSPQPWRNEEQMDRQRSEQTGQLPQ